LHEEADHNDLNISTKDSLAD